MVRIVSIFGALALMGYVPSTFAQTDRLRPEETLLTVEAQGRLFVKPDVMAITAGAVTEGKTSIEAIESNNALIARLLAVLSTSGIAISDIRTANFRLTPVFSNERDRDEDRPGIITGYNAHNTLNIKFRDLSKAGDIISRLYGEGANTVDGPRFSIANEAPVARALEKAAIAEARTQAESYAEALNMKIVRVSRVADTRDGFEREGNSIIVTGSRINPTPIEPGEIEVESQIYVDFVLVPR